MCAEFCFITFDVLERAVKKDVPKWFSFLAKAAVGRGLGLPMDIKSVGELMLFLQFEIKSSEDFIAWINRNGPTNDLLKPHFHFVCEVLADYLEQWQEKPSEYMWTVMLLRGDFDD